MIVRATVWMYVYKLIITLNLKFLGQPYMQTEERALPNFPWILTNIVKCALAFRYLSISYLLTISINNKSIKI